MFRVIAKLTLAVDCYRQQQKQQQLVAKKFDRRPYAESTQNHHAVLQSIAIISIILILPKIITIKVNKLRL